MTFHRHLDRLDTYWRFIGRRAISLHLSFTFEELEDQKLQAACRLMRPRQYSDLDDWVENVSGEEAIALG